MPEVRTYLVECEVMSRNPQIACNASPEMEFSREFDVGRDAVTFAREWVANYSGADLPRAYVNRDKGFRKLRGRVFSCWRTAAGEVRERRHLEKQDEATGLTRS